jgi:hypothetical protein
MQEQLPLFSEVPRVTTNTRPEQTIWTNDGFIRAHRPAKTVTTYEGAPAINEPVSGPLDPLTLERDVKWDEIRKFRQQAQNEAAVRNWYNRRSDQLQPVYPGEAKRVEAEAGLYSKLGQHAGRLETDILDQAEPGLGGDVYRRHQDMAGLLEGGAWLDRAPKTGPTSRSQIAFNPWQGRAFVAGQDALHAGAMAGYQALRSPFARYVALPAARAAWLNSAWDRLDNPTTDIEGNPRIPNPWANIYKYGAPTP